MAGTAPPTPGGPMTVLLVVLAALWLATGAYLVVVLRQIGAVRRQLEQRTGQDSPSAVTLALVVPQLEQLTSRVNEAVEQSRQASMRTREVSCSSCGTT